MLANSGHALSSQHNSISLEDLPCELLYEICQQLRRDDALYNLACCSRNLNKIAIPIFLKSHGVESRPVKELYLVLDCDRRPGCLRLGPGASGGEWGCASRNDVSFGLMHGYGSGEGIDASIVAESDGEGDEGLYQDAQQMVRSDVTLVHRGNLVCTKYPLTQSNSSWSWCMRDALSGLQADFETRSLAQLTVSFKQNRWEPTSILIQLRRVYNFVQRLSSLEVLTLRFESDTRYRDVIGLKKAALSQEWAETLGGLWDVAVRSKGCKTVQMQNQSWWIKDWSPSILPYRRCALTKPLVALRDCVKVSLEQFRERSMAVGVGSTRAVTGAEERPSVVGVEGASMKTGSDMESLFIQSSILLLPPTLKQTLHVLKTSPNLTSLTLSRIVLVPSVFSQRLLLLIRSLANPQGLRSLSLQGCHHLTLPLLLRVLHHLPGLEYLSLDRRAEYYFPQTPRPPAPALEKLKYLEAPSDFVLFFMEASKLKNLEKVWVYPRSSRCGLFGYERNGSKLKRILEKTSSLAAGRKPVEVGLDLQLDHITHRLGMHGDIEACLTALQREQEQEQEGEHDRVSHKRLSVFSSSTDESDTFSFSRALDGEYLLNGEQEGWGSLVNHVAINCFDVTQDDHAILAAWMKALFPRATSLRLTRPVISKPFTVVPGGSLYVDLPEGGALTPSNNHEYFSGLDGRSSDNGVDEVMDSRSMDLIQELSKTKCTHLKWMVVGGKRYSMP
ncbi:hypothetical protein AMATHDRAFT_45477 [Amanita thiersii Skay4041]|uniref:F-box domain-containing protein n=1 Tax=Amanita thiersii Skay4041 TaxID=703135 RepID=A0A2A9NW49_9AGAR|nr:hypothetical protein AMATHDRAFT_45477 [Amanita thiersii Skay4041]